MLTVKIITPEQNEWIHEAFSISKNPPKQSLSGHESISCFLLDKTCLDIYKGQVYVMNDNGKTIGNYYLSWPDELEFEQNELDELVQNKKELLQNKQDLTSINLDIERKRKEINILNNK